MINYSYNTFYLNWDLKFSVVILHAIDDLQCVRSSSRPNVAYVWVIGPWKHKCLIWAPSPLGESQNEHAVFNCILHHHHHHHHQSVLLKGTSFAANSGTNAAILPKGRSSTANFGTKVAVLPGMNKCGSFPLLSASRSLFSIWTNLERSQKIPGAPVGRWRVDLTNWALRTLPKFTTGIKYQFRQGFWPDQRSGNLNHHSPSNCRIHSF